MKLLSLFGFILLLTGCTFGVPISGDPAPQSDNVAASTAAAADGSMPRSKYGNPKSYIVNGKRYFVMKSAHGFVQRGIASWYGPDFHGKRTSSGEIYNMHAMTAAHKTLPLPVWVRVKNLRNGKTVIVKVNDRGPFVGNRILDLSYAAAQKLDVVGPGTAEVEITALTGLSNTTKKRPPVRAIPLATETAPVDGGDIFLQLGAFSSEVNAANLRSQLRDDKEQAIVISSIETSSGTFYRVLLGPLLDVKEAFSVQKRLMRKGYSQARIVIGED